MVDLKHNLRKKLESSKKVFGPIIGPGNKPAKTVKMLADAGFDFVLLDLEHNLVNKETIFDYIRACTEMEMPIIVRPEENMAFFRSFLDSGANGMMLSHVDTVEQAVFAVNQSYYPPLGNRGCGMGPYLIDPQSRSGQPFLTLTEHVNANTLIFPQTESLKSINNLGNILKLDGITGTIVGSFDLAIDIGDIDPGATLQEIIETAVVEENLGKVSKICREAGKVAGIGGLTPKGCAKWAREGYQLFLIGQVINGNLNSAKQLIENAKSLVD